MNNRPIGIFDSGLGGLTVANAIRQTLPNESLFYFGDTAHLPYGDKSTEAIKGYASRITEFLLEHDAKVILIACNSASASAYDHLKEKYGERVIVMDVIDPMVEYVCNADFSKIGVIGTKRTISSNTYAQKIAEKNSSIQVVSLATPLLAPMIEEGFIFDDISNAILRTYLSNKQLSDIQALILGCTHYPIIKNQINKIFNFDVKILDSSFIVSAMLKKTLEVNHLLSDSRDDAKYNFYVSDYNPFFEKMANMFFDGDIQIKEADIWK